LAEQKSNDTVFILIKGKTIVLRGVNFEFNKATLTEDSERILWRAYNAMVANPDVRVVISGHTDNVGSQKYNQALSLRRAQSVKNWLVKEGIASNRMRTVGKGLNEPVASNETDAGRAENRRIEFYVEK
jgi:OOP family OmpA-OmpF porin